MILVIVQQFVEDIKSSGVAEVLALFAAKFESSRIREHSDDRPGYAPNSHESGYRRIAYFPVRGL